MSLTKFKVGDVVKFKGTKGDDWRAMATGPGSQDTFVARITSTPHNACYCLTYLTGEPVGLPFHDGTLELVLGLAR